MSTDMICMHTATFAYIQIYGLIDACSLDRWTARSSFLQLLDQFRQGLAGGQMGSQCKAMPPRSLKFRVRERPISNLKESEMGHRWQ